jgi:hypothetical protein
VLHHPIQQRRRHVLRHLCLHQPKSRGSRRPAATGLSARPGFSPFRSVRLPVVKTPRYWYTELKRKFEGFSSTGACGSHPLSCPGRPVVHFGCCEADPVASHGQGFESFVVTPEIP